MIMPTKKYYKVADYVFALDFPREDDLMDKMLNLKPFVCEASDPIFTLSLCDGLRKDGAETIFRSDSDPQMAMLNLYSRDGRYLVEMAPLPSLPVVAWMEMAADFTEACIAWEPGVSESSKMFAMNNAMMLLFAFRTATLGGLEFHSSTVVKDGRGYMFLGPSGTGKSTHSSLWLKHIPEVELLNDDNPAVRVFPDGKAIVYGTPWSGKTPCYKNKSVPVGAIVRLRQAPENRIQKLGPVQAYATLMTSTSGFRPFKGIADGMHASLSALVAAVPCYELECLPDKDAAELSYNTIAKN